MLSDSSYTFVTFLFNGTIAENIGYARPGASQQEIEEAARAANIHEDILNMPEQYETRVGERGLRLSGGQTEKQIQKAIKNITGKRTIVAIAHRLSTIKDADMILVIHEGRIVEQGTHDELLKLQGLYYKMHQVQE